MSPTSKKVGRVFKQATTIKNSSANVRAREATAHAENLIGWQWSLRDI
jgi:hypothetical protein